MRTVLIMRGVPGSGKSTFARHAKELAEREGKTAIIHSTDDLRMVDGKYVFDARDNAKHHRTNMFNFLDSIRAGINLVIIDNINIRRADYRFYVDRGRMLGYEILIQVMPHPDPKLAAWRNLHGADEDTIRSYLAVWEN